MTIKLKNIALHTIFVVALTFIVVYGYTNSLLLYLKGDYYNNYQLEEGLFIGALYLIIYLLITIVFLTRITESKWLKIGVAFVYTWVVYALLSSIAFSMLADLSGGGTFTSSEVISTFVLGYKETVALISMTTLVYYLFLKLLPLNNYKTS